LYCARAVQHWLAANPSQARISVVWEPMLPSDDRVAAEAAVSMFQDPRVVQFWDPERRAGAKWSVEFQVDHARAALDSLAPDSEMRPRVEAWVQAPANIVMWDVAYFYRRGVRWRDRIPAPIAWTKQMGFWGTDDDSAGAAAVLDSNLVTGQFWCDRRAHGVVESDWFREFAGGMSRVTAR